MAAAASAPPLPSDSSCQPVALLLQLSLCGVPVPPAAPQGDAWHSADDGMAADHWLRSCAALLTAWLMQYPMSGRRNGDPPLLVLYAATDNVPAAAAAPSTASAAATAPSAATDRSIVLAKVCRRSS
jgi:hypothetical protein